MKAVAMPVNLIVILIIALLVMLALAAFFSSGFGGGGSAMSDAAALQKGCGIWQARGCDKTECDAGTCQIYIKDYRPEGENEDRTLMKACDRVLGPDSTKTPNKCYQYCCTGLRDT
jgi:hypothetical protein